jgi:hypothetical protein
VRTANGSVVQFLYGEDGMDGTAIEAQKLESLRMSPNKFRVCFPPPFSVHSSPTWIPCLLESIAKLTAVNMTGWGAPVRNR